MALGRPPSGWAPQHSVVGHKTRGHIYEPIEVASPTCWLLAKHGAIQLGAFAVPVSDLVTARAMPWVQNLPGCGAIISKLDLLLSGFFDIWPISPGDLQSFWPAVFAVCADSDVSVRFARAVTRRRQRAVKCLNESGSKGNSYRSRTATQRVLARLPFRPKGPAFRLSCCLPKRSKPGANMARESGERHSRTI